MHVLEDSSKCSGCHACFSACPSKCIAMLPDAEGFLQPYIDKTLCTDCGLCKRVCPVVQNQIGKKGEAYACVSTNENVRMQSSSGGVFSLLAEHILSEGGIVFGAAFDEALDVLHIGIDKAEDLIKLRGSKYVQSRIGDAYQRAKAHLDNGKIVLFTGTPCQISGLKLYLGKDYENLYTQDIVCHGVPSPAVWKAYVAHREKRSASKANNAFFRHKISGWKKFSIVFDFSDGSTYAQSLHRDPYMKGFLSNLFLRTSCHACASKTLERVSDITLADFWGADKLLATPDDDKGISLVVVNSEKGKRLFAAITASMRMQNVVLDDAVQYNSAACHCVPRPQNRERFFEMFGKMDFEKTVDKCVPKRTLRKYMGKAKRWIKRMCKKHV